MEKLPPNQPIEEIETRQVLKKLNKAYSALAELRGTSATIPNQQILVDTLSIQEAKDSSEIENIVTTHDELYRCDLQAGIFPSPAAKEVAAYKDALKAGFEEVKEQKVIKTSTILKVQKLIEGNDAGIRSQPGTKLTNQATGEVVYNPPQNHDEILALLDNLVWFVNYKEAYEADPLVKMAIIHHQFESIHPFYDGNGRTGRILNILYLVLNEELNLPILYLSRYIIRNRQEYYRLLQETREKGNWEEWVLYVLEAVEVTSLETIRKIKDIRALMQSYKHQIRERREKIYSQDLLNNLFRHPYTRIALLQDELGVSWRTARTYLEELTDMGLLKKEKKGRNSYYINKALIDILVREKTASQAEKSMQSD